MNRPCFGLTVALLALLSGCSSAGKVQFTERPATAAELATLVDVDFTVTRLVAQGQTVTLPSERPPTLRLLGADRIAGFAGVNRFNGAWQLRDKGVVQWSPAMASTRMAGPPERMQLEYAFLKTLPETTRLTLTPHGVIFSNEDGSNLVEAKR